MYLSKINISKNLFRKKKRDIWQTVGSPKCACHIELYTEKEKKKKESKKEMEPRVECEVHEMVVVKLDSGLFVGALVTNPLENIKGIIKVCK